MTNEIVLYQPNEQMSLEVKLENETVWLNRQQLSILFDRDVKTIGKHINNALKEELYPVVTKSTTTGNDSTSNATVAKFAIVQKEGNRMVRLLSHGHAHIRTIAKTPYIVRLV